ncbi:MAG TPA: hypothetical protein VIW70_01585 [Rubrivivax sp.]
MKALPLVPAPRYLLPVLCSAALLALVILVFYVQLLQESVARGDRFRSEQRLLDRGLATKAGPAIARSQGQAKS